MGDTVSECTTLKPYYEHAGITIYHGDCREVLPGIEEKSVDVVITSPPYNLGSTPWQALGHWRPGHKCSGGQGKWKRGSASSARGVNYGTHADSMPWEEYVEWQRQVISLLWRTLTDCGAIFYNHKPRVVGERLWLPLELVPDGIPLRQIIAWDRGGGINYTTTAFVPMQEWILLLAKPEFRLKSTGVSGLGDVWRVSPKPSELHPAPFPTAIPARSLEAVDASLVLDPFAGSGTTLRAAKNAGIKAIGIEIEERYCEIAANRLAQEVLF